MQLTVTVVTYNSASAIVRTLESLVEAVSHIDAEIVVIDNASSDGTASVAERTLGNNGVVLAMAENLGYGDAVNHVAKQARGKYLLMMNDDVIVQAYAIDRLLLTLLENPRIAVVGPLLAFPDGSPTHTMTRWVPGWRDELAKVGDRVSGTHVRSTLPDESGVTEVGVLYAACALIETKYFGDIGGFGEAFFVYGQDLDLCRRIASLGRPVAVDTRSVAIHYQDEDLDRRVKGLEFSLRVWDSRDTYYRIWLSRPSRMLLNLWHTVGRADQPSRARYHLRKAVYDGPSLGRLRRLNPLEYARPGERQEP